MNKTPTKEEYFNQLQMKIIAIDFDATITLPNYATHSPLNKQAKKYLDKLHSKGYRLVLWSARVNYKYDEAYDRCINEFDMPYIEKDSDDLIHGATGKLLANFYIDDKSVPWKKIHWRKLYKFIINNI